ncbi:MAG TPA: cell wall hydrolase [Rhizomicrobium sp.]|jgi:spore germination cell wall hydrolase CwlJ-like protein
MTRKSLEAVRRADHAMIGVLALVIATVSAAAGAAVVYRPYTDHTAKVARAAPIVVAATSSLPVSSAPTADQIAASAAAPKNQSELRMSAPSARTDLPSVIDASNVTPSSVDPVPADIAPTPVSTGAGMNPIMADLFREHRCLSDALYFEARGEGEQGEMAVAEVVFHRLQSGKYGRSICNIVYSGADKHACQFSFACDGSLLRPRTAAAWKRAQLLAAQIMVGQARLLNITGGATSFHALTAAPEWSGNLERTAQIGNHVFYKTLPRSRPL